MIMLVIRRQITYQVNTAMSYKPVVSCSGVIALIGHSGITALIKGVVLIDQLSFATTILHDIAD